MRAAQTIEPHVVPSAGPAAWALRLRHAPGATGTGPHFLAEVANALAEGLPRHWPAAASLCAMRKVGRHADGSGVSLELGLPAKALPAGPHSDFVDAARGLVAGLPVRLKLHFAGLHALHIPVLSPGPAGADLCIQFHTPMQMPCSPGGLNLALWLALLQERLAGLGLRCPGLQEDGEMRLLCHYAHPVGLNVPQAHSVNHKSGRTLSMLQGSLFLRRPTVAMLQAMQMLQPWLLPGPQRRHAVAWRGHYSLRWQSTPWLDHGLLNRKRLNGAARVTAQAEHPPLMTNAQGALSTPAAHAHTLLQALRTHSYKPQPSDVLVLHRPGKKPRLIEQLAASDTFLQHHVQGLLAPVLERYFLPSSFGFRPQLGREAALRAVREALAQGYSHVLCTDIADCFGSVQHSVLKAKLDAVLLQSDTATRSVLAASMGQPYKLEGELRRRSQGLAQGAPLAPLLVNLYLHDLDVALAGLPVVAARYADDILVLARGKTDARAALQALHQATAALGLRLAEEKTRICHVQEGFTFLGEQFRPGQSEPLPAAVMAQRKPLIITWPWLQLGIQSGAVEARRGNQVLGRWPLRRLSALVVLAKANLSTTLIERCMAQDVGITLQLNGGHDMLLCPPARRQQLEALCRHQVWHAGMSEGQRLAIAQALVAAKIYNQRTLVQQREPRNAALLESLTEQRRLALGCASVQALRGHEGHAAKLVFRWINAQVLPAQRAQFRSQRRARGGLDRLNSLLNFGYHLLATRARAWVAANALNPYLGWLHDGMGPYETLVYDLIEPFRPFVDRFVLRVINRQEVRASHFELGANGLQLRSAEAAQFAARFERAMGERAGTHLVRDMLWVQVRAVAAAMNGSGTLWVAQWEPRAKQGPDATGEEAMLWVPMPEDAEAEVGAPWASDTALAEAQP